jgi:hypothetical protein
VGAPREFAKRFRILRAAQFSGLSAPAGGTKVTVARPEILMRPAKADHVSSNPPALADTPIQCLGANYGLFQRFQRRAIRTGGVLE